MTVTQTTGSETTESTTGGTTESTGTTQTTNTTNTTESGYQVKMASELRPPQDAYLDVPIPNNPGRHAYAMMGSGNGPTATLFGNWKCPYTQDFVLKHLPKIIEEYVRPGDLSIRFRALSYVGGSPFLGSDAPRAARAGLGVWHRDPDAFWKYFGTAFLNQPPEQYEWATTKQLAQLATASDVDGASRIANAAADGANEERVKATTRAARRTGVSTVPRVVVNGEVTAPTVEYKETKQALDAAVR